MTIKRLLPLLLLFLCACSSNQVVPKHSAEQYFQEGERFYESHRLLGKGSRQLLLSGVEYAGRVENR